MTRTFEFLIKASSNLAFTAWCIQCQHMTQRYFRGATKEADVSALSEKPFFVCERRIFKKTFGQT